MRLNKISKRHWSVSYYKHIFFSRFFCTEIQAAGGIISTEDITSYRPLRLDPLSVTFMGGSTYVGKYQKFFSSSRKVDVDTVIEILCFLYCFVLIYAASLSPIRTPLFSFTLYYYPQPLHYPTIYYLHYCI